MTYKAVYKDALGTLVTEVIEGNYEKAWRHCELKTLESQDKQFFLKEVKQ